MVCDGRPVCVAGSRATVSVIRVIRITSSTDERKKRMLKTSVLRERERRSVAESCGERRLRKQTLFRVSLM